MVRSQLNRLLLVAVLLLVLTGIAIAERLRRGASRRIAVTTIRRVARACGIRIETAGSESIEPGALPGFGDLRIYRRAADAAKAA